MAEFPCTNNKHLRNSFDLLRNDVVLLNKRHGRARYIPNFEILLCNPLLYPAHVAAGHQKYQYLYPVDLPQSINARIYLSKTCCFGCCVN